MKLLSSNCHPLKKPQVQDHGIPNAARSLSAHQRTIIRLFLAVRRVKLFFAVRRGKRSDSGKLPRVFFQDPRCQFAKAAHIYQAYIKPPQEIKCGCRNRCVSHFCTCRKWGSACGPSCACHASSRCKNHLNLILPALFTRVHGEYLPANDCFAQFLAEEVRLDFKNEDFEDLIGNLRKIFIRHAYKNITVLSSHPPDSDKYLRQWLSTWMQSFMEPMERNRLLKDLLQYGLLDDHAHDDSAAGDDDAHENEDERAFYSFCKERWVLKSRMWHCRVCGKCRSRRHWYCGKCKTCTHGLTEKCKGCGGVSEEYYARSDDDDSDDVSDTDCESEDGSDTRSD